MTTKSNQLAKQDKGSPAERFTGAVMKEFPNGVNGEELKLTSFQKKLIQNYFIKLDSMLREAEAKRMKKSEQYREALEYAWANINVHKLAQDVVAFSSIGLDPLQSNHIHPIPYRNDKTGQYDIVLMEGYNGMELKARKYGFDVPDEVIFELKYSGDHFKSIKKSKDNKVENYEFQIEDDFNRGELEGGFYYMIFNEREEKNKLVVLNRQQIEKRKPKYASAEFWGGEKDEWKNGKKTGKKEAVEGWAEEMYMKTLKRHCWNSINIDSQKIDDHLMRVLENEAQANDRNVEEQIAQKANKKHINLDMPEANGINDIKVDKHEEVMPGEFEDDKAIKQGTLSGAGF